MSIVQTLLLKKFVAFCNIKWFQKSHVSVSERSNLGFVSTFCSNSQSRNVNVSSRSRRFWSRLQLWLIVISLLNCLFCSIFILLSLESDGYVMFWTNPHPIRNCSFPGFPVVSLISLLICYLFEAAVRQAEILTAKCLIQGRNNVRVEGESSYQRWSPTVMEGGSCVQRSE